MRRVETVVVGAGVMGSATARALSRDGRQVVLLEQFELGHDRGSSHGAARIFRYSYPDKMFVEMAMEALPMWRELEAESGQQLIRPTGGIDTGLGVANNAAALEACGATIELMDGREAGVRWPFITLPPDEEVLYSPDSGVIAAQRAVLTFAESAKGSGAEIITNARVERLELSNGSVEVVTADETFLADVAVVTAGGWAQGLLEPVGIHLDVKVSLETVAYFKLDDPTPTFVDWGRPTAYALPDPEQGLKAGQHIAGPTVDPDRQGEPSEDSIKVVSQWVADRFPNAERVPHFAETCLYTKTPDECFVLERHGPIVVGSPCSGHGFKFAPLIGRRLADLAAG